MEIRKEIERRRKRREERDNNSNRRIVNPFCKENQIRIGVNELREIESHKLEIINQHIKESEEEEEEKDQYRRRGKSKGKYDSKGKSKYMFCYFQRIGLRDGRR